MKYRLEEGNYERTSPQIQGDRVTFTFEGAADSQCTVVLYQTGNVEVQERIEVPEEYHIGNLHSVTVTGLDVSKYDYNYEINGEIVTDPYAKSIAGREIWADGKRLAEEIPVRSAFCRRDFDWKGDVKPKLSDEEMIMYKLHVREFSMEGHARGRKKGTFAAITENIDYFKELGVTVLELMPVYEFEEIRKPEKRHKQKELSMAKYQIRAKEQEEAEQVRLNCWGYGPADYFAPKKAFSSRTDASEELKELILALHENHMECVLEFYFEEHANHGLILDILRYWVKEYHVDGFHLLGLTLPLTAVTEDPLLAETKIFYTGFLPEMIEEERDRNRFFVYNEEFLYPARKMLCRRDQNMGELIEQFTRSHKGQGFVNYITSNNGFTMADLFSYENKHNEANGEGGADGSDWNYSMNCGEEGPARKKAVLLLRKKMIRNAFTLLLLAKGVPLIYEGDEIANSKQGNNNTYCQDNSTAYVNWKKAKKEAALTDFVRQLIAFRKEHPVLSDRRTVLENIRTKSGLPEVSFHGESAWINGLEPGRTAVGILYCGEYAKKADGSWDNMIYLACNFGSAAAALALPKSVGGGCWLRMLDTDRDQEPFLTEPEEITGNIVIIPAQSISVYCSFSCLPTGE